MLQMLPHAIRGLEVEALEQPRRHVAAATAAAALGALRSIGLGGLGRPGAALFVADIHGRIGSDRCACRDVLATVLLVREADGEAGD